MSGNLSRKLGRLGEKEFGRLCTLQGASCNKSEEDDHGWDYIVEVEPEENSALPADLRKRITRALVQVKSTRSKGQKAKVSLSNALKAIKTDLPCFLALMMFDENELKEVRLIHFWSGEIERVLKKAREAYRDKRMDLNKIRMEFSFEGSPDVQTRLVQTLCSQVDSYGADYAQKKKALHDDVGYGETRFAGQITFDSSVTVEEIVGLELGSISKLPLAHIDMKDQRFDIPVSITEQPSQGSSISMNPKPWKGHVRLSHGKRTLELDANFYSPSIVPVENPAFKIRVQTALFDLQLSPHHGGIVTAKMTIAPVTLWDLYVLAEIANWNAKGEISCAVASEQGILFRGTINPKIEVENWTRVVGAGGWIAECIVGRSYLMEVSADEEAAWHQLKRLARFVGFFNDDKKNFGFQTDRILEDLAFDYVSAYLAFELGEHCHSATLLFPVKEQKQEGEDWDIEFGPPEVENYRRFKTDLEIMKVDAKKELEERIKQPKEVHMSMFSGDIYDWIDPPEHSSVLLGPD